MSMQKKLEVTLEVVSSRPTLIREGYRSMLYQELTRRCTTNPAYSMRSFARHLGISAATLSGVLNNRRKLSLETAEKIVIKLALDPRDAAKFYRSVAAEYLTNSANAFNLEE